LQRVAVLGLGVLSVWLIVFVFRWADSSLPWIVALSVSYGIAAYLILQRDVRMGLKILQRRHVPRFTVTSDGLLGDPVSLPWGSFALLLLPRAGQEQIPWA
jgi:hypothetical protein